MSWFNWEVLMLSEFIIQSTSSIQEPFSFGVCYPKEWPALQSCHNGIEYKTGGSLHLQKQETGDIPISRLPNIIEIGLLPAVQSERPQGSARLLLLPRCRQTNFSHSLRCLKLKHYCIEECVKVVFSLYWLHLEENDEILTIGSFVLFL